jgi:hypothetical protein
MTPVPGLHPSVTDAWHVFSEPLEGRVPYMYLDVKNLITTAVGKLVDPIDLALPLPWRLDGRPATPREVREDWLALHNENNRRLRWGVKPLSKLHHKFAAPYTRVRLDAIGIDAIVADTLALFVRKLIAIFPAFESFPADAQLAICSMAWACGPGFDVDAFDNGNGGWPNFCRLVRARDWAGCVAGLDANHDGIADSFAAKIRETGNAGVVPRNKANALCFSNAAWVENHGLDRSRLFWPDPASAYVLVGPSRPVPLAGPVSVADSVVSDALRELTRSEP